jgi:hypothetical protein
VDAGYVADDSEIHAATIFKVEMYRMRRVIACIIVHVSKEPEGRAKFDSIHESSMHLRNAGNPANIHAIKTSNS